MGVWNYHGDVVIGTSERTNPQHKTQSGWSQKPDHYLGVYMLTAKASRIPKDAGRGRGLGGRRGGGGACVRACRTPV